MNLHQLRTFESVARNRSFTRAAAELSLTQPAVSVQIRALEESLGAELFERLGRDVGLTQAGSFLLDYARRILALLEEARSAVDDLQGLRRGRVSLATVSTPGAYVLPPLLGAFRDRYPGIRVTLEVTNRATVRRRLLDHDADLVIMGRPPEDVDHVARPFLENDLVVVAAPDHPLAVKRRIPLAALAQEPLVVREPGSGTRNAMEEHFLKRGMPPRVSLEVGDNSGVKEAVAEGLGISVISRHALNMELALGRLAILDVQGFPLHRQWYVVRSPARRPSRAVAAFEEFLMTSARDVLRRPLSRGADPQGRPSGARRSRRPTRAARERGPGSPGRAAARGGEGAVGRARTAPVGPRPVVLGIVGDSAAGKTTLTRGLIDLLGRERVTHVCVDDYHKYDRRERSALGITALHPDCNHLDIIELHLERLHYGQPIMKPVYDHSTGTLVRPEYVCPREIVIVEGLLGFHTPVMRQFYDIKVYLDPTEDLRRFWKVRRDTTKRAYTTEQVLAELERREPDSRAFIRPQREHADIAVRFMPAAGAAAEEVGPHPDVQLTLRPTIPHPDLSYLVDGGAKAGSGIRLSKGGDAEHPVEILEIEGNVTPQHAARLEAAIWQHLPELSSLPADRFGNYLDLYEMRHSDPLALTQLLLTCHVLRGQTDRAFAQPVAALSRLRVPMDGAAHSAPASCPE